MKKVFGVLLFAGIVLAPAQPASAQQNWTVIGLSAKVVVVNTTSDNTPVMAQIGDKNIGPLTMGQRGDTKVRGSGQIPIIIHPCADTATAYRPNWPPDWATNTGNFPGDALTKDYLVQHPSTKDIKAHIDRIAHSLKGQPGAKGKKKELEDWLNLIKNIGITTEVTNCTELQPMTAVFSWEMWSPYYVTEPVTMLTITGDRKNGFRIQNPPRWVY
jgi:hypothetical protein